MLVDIMDEMRSEGDVYRRFGCPYQQQQFCSVQRHGDKERGVSDKQPSNQRFRATSSSSSMEY